MNSVQPVLDYLETHRWIQGQRDDDHGGVCIMGAIDAVYGTGFGGLLNNRRRNRAIKAIDNAILGSKYGSHNVLFPELGPMEGVSIITHYNDDFYTRREDVLRVLALASKEN